mmetsp:Transcript_22402/g.55532  ORF Transcript_22402/g.55532 Transcript_22402/m.55532 type:complete len:244 (+) Transcript_22402:2202-2933(+)
MLMSSWTAACWSSACMWLRILFAVCGCCACAAAMRCKWRWCGWWLSVSAPASLMTTSRSGGYCGFSAAAAPACSNRATASPRVAKPLFWGSEAAAGTFAIAIDGSASLWGAVGCGARACCCNCCCCFFPLFFGPFLALVGFLLAPPLLLAMLFPICSATDARIAAPCACCCAAVLMFVNVSMDWFRACSCKSFSCSWSCNCSCCRRCSSRTAISIRCCCAKRAAAPAESFCCCDCAACCCCWK